MSERPKCKAVVWRKDEYRRTGRVRGGFEMHYNRGQCSRSATESGFCWQHERERRLGVNVATYE